MAASEDEGRAVHARIDRVARAFLSTPVRYAGSIPLDPTVPAAVRRRTPVTVAAPEAAASLAIRQLARVLSGESEATHRADQRKGFLARLAALVTAR